MELKPLQSSETAWCWFSKDHSDPDQQDGMYPSFVSITLSKCVNLGIIILFIIVCVWFNFTLT